MSSRDLFAFEWLTHLKWVGRKYQILLPNIKSNRLTFNIQQLYKRNVQIFQTCMSKHWKSKNSALQENEWTWGKILCLAFFALRYMLALSWRKVWGWFQELGSHYFVRAMFRSQRWLYCPFLLVCFRILLLQCLDFQQWVPYYKNKNGTDCSIVVNWLQPKSHCCHICPQYWSLQKNFSKKIRKMCCRGLAGYSGGAGANNNKQGSNWLKVAHHLLDFGQVYPLVCHRSNGECNIGNEQQNIKFLCNPISSLPPLWFSVDRRVWSESQKIYHVFCSYQALLMTLKVIILLSV